MFAGVDIGSVTTKVVLINSTDDIVAFSQSATLFDRKKSGENVLNQTLEKAGVGLDKIKSIYATGYGRRSVDFADKAMSEIICHALGTKFLIPDVRTIIDIGGQDSKVIGLDKEGNITKFEMNDKCAAGTGRFLEVLTDRILNMKLEELGPVSLQCKSPCVLSSICTVFAESEIVSYLSEKRSVADIVCGMNRAIAKRVVNMGIGGQIKYENAIVFSGGVARNIGVVNAIESELKKKVIIPSEPQSTAALGAALFAKRAALGNN